MIYYNVFAQGYLSPSSRRQLSGGQNDADALQGAPVRSTCTLAGFRQAEGHPGIAGRPRIRTRCRLAVPVHTAFIALC
jgi:hypothetical protein